MKTGGIKEFSSMIFILLILGAFALGVLCGGRIVEKNLVASGFIPGDSPSINEGATKKGVRQ
jgi:hypothetical protein